MTTQECDNRDKRFLKNIRSMLSVHEQLREHAANLRLSIENAAIVVRGQLPSSELKAELVLAIRRAGVLSRVCNNVHVRG